MNFSERNGYKKPKCNPLESMDESLKNDIWTRVHTVIKDKFISHGDDGYYSTTYKEDSAKLLWTAFFKQSISNLPAASEFLKEIEPFYNALAWNEVYDLIEFILGKSELKQRDSNIFNKILEENNSSYRIIDCRVQPISDQEVISIMDSAYSSAFNIEVKNHLKRARILFSNKKTPDFYNSCLESIKAVEAGCRFVLKNEKILGDNIKKFQNGEKNYNRHIINILEKINAFRGDCVAHATKPGASINREDAILIHTMCCGFINYFKSNQ